LGRAETEYAAVKFFLYTLAGSVFMLLGILALYFSSAPRTFDHVELTRQSSAFVGTRFIWVFLALFVGFAVKVPAFPFHTWLPLAHVEAPTAVSVILAGVLLKMGTYGLLRVCPTASFPKPPDGSSPYPARDGGHQHRLRGLLRHEPERT
jgi:NADH-quinone oxidoreductase subunit M